MRRAERGFTLLETLVALTLVVGAVLPLLALLRAETLARAEMAHRERRVEEAHATLVGLSLLPREELDRRLGSRPAGGFVVHVNRPEPELYRVAVADSADPSSELLVTVVHRARHAP